MNGKRNRSARRRVRNTLAGFCLILPMLMGGCPTFRNEVIDIANNATQGLVLGNLTEEEAVETATRNVLSALIDLAFDSLRDTSTTSSYYR